jgi:hypothetical protein
LFNELKTGASRPKRFLLFSPIENLRYARANTSSSSTEFGSFDRSTIEDGLLELAKDFPARHIEKQQNQSMHLVIISIWNS